MESAFISRSKAVALGVLVACSAACGNKSTPTPSRDPLPAPSASVSANTPPPAPSASANASATAAVKTIPTLVLEKFAPKGVHAIGLYAIEGAIMVTEGQRAGRIVDDDIEWIGKIPKGSEALGDNFLQSVVGRWPDDVAALYVSGNGRAPRPTWHPLTGKKVAEYTVAEVGAIRGVARVGESTLLLSDGPGIDPEIVTVRGPRLLRKMITDKQAGCKPGEIWKFNADTEVPAVPPRAMQSTPRGTLMTIGTLCDKRAPAVEVWDENGKSRIVDLGQWWKKASYWPALVKGSGDELFAYSDGFRPILRYHEGAFDPLPELERPLQKVWSSARGRLHGYDGQTIFRFEEGKWTPVGRFAEPKDIAAFAIDEKDALWVSAMGLYRIREAPAPAAPIEEGCQSWFVYLYQVSDKSEPNYTFPTTRKALSSFPEVADLGLVDFKDDYRRHLGVTVARKAQGEAVVAHIKATMKDEDPKLFCYAPSNPRKIDMNAKTK